MSQTITKDINAIILDNSPLNKWRKSASKMRRVGGVRRLRRLGRLRRLRRVKRLGRVIRMEKQGRMWRMGEK